MIYSMYPFKYNIIPSSFFQWSKGFHFSQKVNEPEEGHNDKIWYFSMVHYTAYLRNECGDPQFSIYCSFFDFWHKDCEC